MIILVDVLWRPDRKASNKQHNPTRIPTYLMLIEKSVLTPGPNIDFFLSTTGSKANKSPEDQLSTSKTWGR